MADFTFRVDPQSVDQCADALDALRQRMQAANSRAVAKGAAAIQSRAKEAASGAPGPKVITGHLRDSIWVTGPNGGGANYEAQIGPTVIYGRIQELGGTIFPKRAKALRWFGPDGEPIFARHVTLPPRPYLKPGLGAAMGEIQQAFQDEWEAALSPTYDATPASPSPPPPPTGADEDEVEERGIHDNEVVRKELERPSYYGKSWNEMTPEERAEARADSTMTEEQIKAYGRAMDLRDARPHVGPRGTGELRVPELLVGRDIEEQDAINAALRRLAERDPDNPLIRRMRGKKPLSTARRAVQRTPAKTARTAKRHSSHPAAHRASRELFRRVRRGMIHF